MTEPDELIHQSLRLKVMAALYAQREEAPLEFSALKTLTGATDGNLGSHLGALEKAGYVQIEKDFLGKRPRTRVAVTAVGARAFRAHVAYLRDIVEGVGG